MGNRFNIGDIVLFNEDGVEKVGTIVSSCGDEFGTKLYMIQVKDDYNDIVPVPEYCINKSFNDEYLNERVQAELAARLYADVFEEEYCEYEDERECEPMDENREYALLFNALKSKESLILRLVDSAASKNPISHAALLAIRDKAEELGCEDIVNAIDTHIEENS